MLSYTGMDSFPLSTGSGAPGYICCLTSSSNPWLKISGSVRLVFETKSSLLNAGLVFRMDFRLYQLLSGRFRRMPPILRISAFISDRSEPDRSPGSLDFQPLVKKEGGPSAKCPSASACTQFPEPRPPYAVGNGSRAGTLLVRYFGVPDRGRLSLHWEVAAIGPLQPKFWKVAELLLADSSRFGRLIPSNARWPRTESASLKTLGRWVFGANLGLSRKN